MSKKKAVEGLPRKKKVVLGVPRPKKVGSRASRAPLRSGPAKKRGLSPSARSRKREGPFVHGDMVRAIPHHGGSFPWESKEFAVVKCKRNEHYGDGWAVTVHSKEHGTYTLGSSWLEMVKATETPIRAKIALKIECNRIADERWPVSEYPAPRFERSREAVGCSDAIFSIVMGYLKVPAAIAIGSAATKEPVGNPTGAKRTAKERGASPRSNRPKTTKK